MPAWDRQLKALADDVDLLLDQHSKIQLRSDRAFRLRAVQILQAKTALDEQLDQLRHLASRDLLLLPRERAMMHGTRTLLARIAAYSALRAEMLTQGLWFNLLKTRLCGPGRVGGLTDNFGAEDLVGLSVRRGGLAQTESYLKERLRQLDRQRRDLTQRYSQLDIEEANRVAALSLGTRLGSTAAAIVGNPLISGLKLLLKSASAGIRQPAAMHRYRQLQSRLHKRTDNFLSLCRHLIVASISHPPGKDSERRAEQERMAAVLGGKLADIDQLTATAQGLFAAALGGPLDPWRPPIHVQMSGKKAKTRTLGK